MCQPAETRIFLAHPQLPNPLAHGLKTIFLVACKDSQRAAVRRYLFNIE